MEAALLHSVPRLVGAVSVITFFYWFGVVIYRLYFHPLKNLPGPKHLAAFESFHSFGNYLKGDWYKYVLQLHEQYGPIVRVAPNRLAVDGSVGWPEIYEHKRASRPEYGRIPAFFDPTGYGRNDIFIANREDHRRHRRLMAHAFSQAAMYEQEPLIKSYVDLLMSRMHEHAAAQKPMNVVKWFNFATFDIIGDLAFAESFHCLDSSNMHPWVSMVFQGIKAGSYLRFSLQNPLLGIFVKSMYGKKMLQKRQEHNALAAEKAQRRIELGPAHDRKDFMTYMLKYNDEKGMSDSEIKQNSSSLIIAGSETTATLLSGLTFYLTRNPETMKRLTHEVRSTFSTEDEITMKSTANMPYLNACIEEGLRCYPPLPESPPRLSPGDYVNGNYIPEGTIVVINQYATYHSSRNWAEPLAFRPERWLPPTHEYYDHKFDHDNRVAFSPFSAGPRNCIGKNLAYSEMRLFLARYVWNFDIELMEGQENWVDQKCFVLWDKAPLMVQLTPVARSSEKLVSA